MRSPGEHEERLPLIVFEDEHLLVVNKPSGLNTHAPAPLAGEGIYEWLRHREPRWATLAIVHRLDKEASGLMVFAKTPLANRSLTRQFAEHGVRKRYLLLTSRRPVRARLTVRTHLVRQGSRYRSSGGSDEGELAETRFAVLSRASGGLWLVAAEPVTGRTHQIRVHAGENGFPIVGDTWYGGVAAPRLYLHAHELRLTHPATGAGRVFALPAGFPAAGCAVLRQALIDPCCTDAYRVAHGEADGALLEGAFVERFGEYLLVARDHPADAPSALAGLLADALEPAAERTGPSGLGGDGGLGTAGAPPEARLGGWMRRAGVRGVYCKQLTRHLRGAAPAETSPVRVFGDAAPDRFEVRENGVRFEIRFNEGSSVGLFPDQRDNRRRVLVNHIAAGFPLFVPGAAGATVLNTFAYTCGFSVCAALGGARTASVDLSAKCLEWGRRNFVLNGLDPASHEFMVGDAFQWLRRLRGRGALYDLVVLDPPTFSKSRVGGLFRAEKDYGRLVGAVLPLLKPNGVLFASTNAAGLPAQAFLGQVDARIRQARRTVVRQHYAPQPPDFPISRAEPAHLKTVWLRIR
ncbi:MAG: class I SAM-dependent methyltransferase [Verrucomicrobia bacterium]|nr:class I SAM-dependent methyltransferase [Verrucomicrobiota bacterium]